jgi:hypothetical protein
MANNRLREIQKSERLKAIKDARRDVYGDVKVLIVYEVLKFSIRQGSRIISKRFYNLIYKERYTFTSQFDEVVKFQQVRARFAKITPFKLEIRLQNDEDVDPLVAYYNEQSKKYFDIIKASGEYDAKRCELVRLESQIRDVNDLIDYIMLIDFKL